MEPKRYKRFAGRIFKDTLAGKILFGVNRVGSGSHGCWQNLKQGVPSFMKLSGGCAKTGGISLGSFLPLP